MSSSAVTQGAKPAASQGKKEKSVGMRLLHVAIALVIVGIFFLLPIDEAALPFAGRMCIGVLLGAVYLWVTEPIPMAVTGFAAMIVMPVFGIMTFNEVWTSWVSSVIFFTFASFALTASILKTKLPLKIVMFLIKVAKGKSAGIVLAFMLASMVVSAFIANIAVIAVFGALAMSTVLEMEKAEPGQSNLGRCLMIGIVFGAMLGGMCTPVGNGMNIMLLGIAGAAGGVSVSFLNWVLMALPICIICLPVSWFVLVKMFKPEPLSDATREGLAQKAAEAGKLTSIDYKVLALFALAVVLWIVGNWTGWDATAISVLIMVLMFIPGIDVLSWKEYISNVEWSLVIIVGAVSSLATGINKSGAASWVVGSAVASITLTSTTLGTLAAGMLPILRLVVPVAPAMIGLVTGPLLGMAASIGMNPVWMTMIIGMEISTFLLAIDSATLLTFRYRYYSMVQYFLAGLVPTILIFILCITLLPTMVGFLGL